MLRGEPALVNSGSPRYGEKASYYSAVCLETGEVEWRELEGNSNSGTSAAFLDQLRKRHFGPLQVIWDNAPAHRGEAVREYLRRPGLGHDAGGIVHRQQQHEPGPPLLQPGMVTAVDLHQHALLGHAPTPEPVLRGAATAGAAQAGPDQNASYRGTAQVNALPFPQQFGEVSVVGASVVVAGQLHHGGRGGFRNGVMGPPSPVPVSQCGGTVPAVRRQKAFGVTFTYSHDLGSLGDG